VLKGYGIIGAVFGLLIVDICILITFIFIIMKKIRYKLPHFYNLKEYMKFGIPTVPGNLSGWIVHSSDKYIIGLLLGTIYVGYYSPAYAVGSIITLYIAPLAVTLPPILSYNYDNKKIYLVNNILEYSYKYYMILAIPSVVGLSLLSKNILILLSTPDIAKESYLVVPFVATGMLIIGSNTIVSQPIFLGKNTRIIGSAWIIAALINIILNIIIIPIVGIIGAAITTLVAFLLIHLIIIYYSRKIIIFNMNIKNIILSIMSSLFFILPFHIINTTNILNIIFCVFICIIIYSILLLLFKVIKIEEINYINRYIIKSYK
jgi:O-antigen/teichoic acid export membrane protein